MEVRKLVQLVAMLACSSVYAEIALDSPDRRIAAFATHFVEPTQWEDQNYWRDHWSVATVVFDLDGDGVCDALVCTPDEQASTYLGWLPIHQVSGFDCFDTVQLLDHLVWKFEAQLVSRGYKKSSFKPKFQTAG